MNLIHKQKLQLVDRQVIELPADSEVLSVANQNGVICIWYKFDRVFLNDTVERTVDIVGTGNPMPEYVGEFIGTVLMDQFVWHVFVD
jgi:hypothetical protein